MSERAGAEETVVSLTHPARIMDPLERCMEERLLPGRSGWSSAPHLGRDLERFFGVRVPLPAIERALRELGRRRSLQLVLDDTGVLWYRIRPDGAPLSRRGPKT